MFSAILTKKEDLKFNGKHPNGINVGYTKFGYMKVRPQVGKTFIMWNSKLSPGLQTSPVTEIVKEVNHGPFEGIIFKTENSVYELQIDIDNSESKL